MKASALTLAAAALAAGTFLLTGCEPGDTVTFNGSGTYNPPTTSDASSNSDGQGVDCDPNGFGPLSGCEGGAADQEQSPQDTSSPGEDDSAEKPADTEPAPCPDDSHNLGTGGFGDGSGCDSSSDAERGYQTGDQNITDGRYDVTVTWVVVNIKFTGFRECVLDLKEASDQPQDRFSRRVTTTEDCKAQQVHTVYQPVASSGK